MSRRSRRVVDYDAVRRPPAVLPAEMLLKVNPFEPMVVFGDVEGGAGRRGDGFVWCGSGGVGSVTTRSRPPVAVKAVGGAG